jgi:starch phosphorylase
MPNRRPDEMRLPPALAGLEDLALDLRWSSAHRAVRIWKRIDTDLWSASLNPWAVLRSCSVLEFERLARDEEFCALVRDSVEHRARQLSDPMWFQRERSQSPLSLSAYFSMEFGLSEGLPIYSGGLGVLAGDMLKAASDLGVPIVGIGLLYQEGYFRQALDAQGGQHELYPANDPSEMPIERARDLAGGLLRIPLEFPGRTVYLRAWIARVGRVSLFLLDSNDPANSALDRGITAQLYNGDPAVRWEQEYILGVGGWRLIRTLRLDPDVLHLNEGHAALAVIERARELIQERKVPFSVALAVARAGTIFTTHTPVAAAFDRYDPALVTRYMARYLTDLGVGMDELLALGREPDANPGDPFNMAYLAIRGSGRINGVSRLHGEVSRPLFSPLFPRWPDSEIPVGHVTNGAHLPSWDSPAAGPLWTEAGKDDPSEGQLMNLVAPLPGLGHVDVWKMRSENRASLIARVRERLARQASAAGAAPDRIDDAGRVLDPRILTIGFARRFTEYKRPTLLLHDKERLTRMILDEKRPIQIVVAGKAHPRDEPGKSMIREWFSFAERPDVSRRVVFLSDYDLDVAAELVQGVDVWLNTPRRPWEASGTSGMKVLVNGGLNLSELDGWWAEAYTPEVGWAIGDGLEHGADPAWDVAEAQALYETLETQVIPLFYERNGDDRPEGWITKIRASMATLSPQFSAARMVRDYVDMYYLPAALSYGSRVADGCRAGWQIERWQATLAKHFGDIAFGALHVERDGDAWDFRIVVSFGALDPALVRVELFSEARDGGQPERTPMERSAPVDHVAFVYTAQIPGDRRPEDFTPRVVPHNDEAVIPLEAREILWQR